MERSTPPPQETLDEALRELEALEEQENDRRRGTDAKISALQGTIGIIVTLVAGSASITGLKSTPLTLWSFLTYLAFGSAIAFFVWAAQQVRKASDPQRIYSRTPQGILQLLESDGSKRGLVLDAINDYKSLILKNQDITNNKLTWYRASIENIIKGVYCLCAVPAVLFVSIIWGALHAECRALTSNTTAVNHVRRRHVNVTLGTIIEKPGTVVRPSPKHSG